MNPVRCTFAIFVISLCVLAGCKSQSELKPSAEGLARAAAKSTQSNLKLALVTDPQKPAAEKPFILRVHVADAADAAVKDAKLRGSLVCKSMDHGKNEFDFTSKGNGDYEATNTAGMDGPWEVKVTAKRGADFAEQTFPFTVASK